MLGKGYLRHEQTLGLGIDVDTLSYNVVGQTGLPLNNVFMVGPSVAGREIVDHGLIGPYSQTISGLRPQAHVIASELAQGAHKPAIRTESLAPTLKP